MEHVRAVARSPLIYPFLVALYPVIFFWAHNIAEAIPPESMAMIIGLVLAGTTVVWVLVRLVLRDASRASFVTATIAACFLTYGRALRAGASTVPPLGRQVLLLIAFGLVIGSACVVAARARWVHAVAPAANVAAGLLVAVNLAVVATHLVRGPGRAEAAAAIEQPPVALPDRPPAQRPDVYYLIFDRYASSKVLAEQFDFDNEPFLGALRQQGFVVLDDAVSNYPRTTQSLASSLNMTYLDDLARLLGPRSTDQTLIKSMFDDPLVVSTFNRLGYHTVNIGSWWIVTESDPGADENVSYWHVDPSVYVFNRTTMLPTLMRLLGLGDGSELEEDIYRLGTGQFDAVTMVADDPRPTFTFAHFLLPHPPYVFTADGRFFGERSLATETPDYVEQLRFVNRQLLEMVRTIRARSTEPPIIVIQADEGPFPLGIEADDPDYDFLLATQADMERKQGILDALLLPGIDPGSVPDTLTPVNTFRLIFSEYFGADLDLLPDRAYVFRSNSLPFEFHDVTRRLRGAP